MKLKETIKKAVITGITTISICSMMILPVYANGNTNQNIESITKPILNLENLMKAIIAAIGVIIVLKNLPDFAQAFQDRDSATTNSSLRGIIAGVMMAGIGTVLLIMGI